LIVSLSPYPEEPARAGVSKDAPERAVASFETRSFGALLRMRAERNYAGHASGGRE